MLKWTASIVLCILFASVAAYAQEETVTYSYNGNPLPIFADSADIISVANIFVPRALRISKVTAKVQVEFDGVGDLNVFLYSAALTRTRLLERNCGSLRNIDTTFDDAATNRFSSACPAAGAGPFQGNEPLANSRDQSSLGVWSLGVENNGSQKIGWLLGFSVTITGTRIATPTITRETVVNNASFRFGGTVAPGEMVSIYGVALGPAAGVAATGGNFPTSLGGTTVLVNGAPAPIAYASYFRVDVQLPFSLSGTASIQVNAANQSSPTVTVDVYNARPGLYTNDAAGTGSIKAVNQDGTLNSKSRPAAKGSIITVYASGLGITTPPVAAGQVTPSNPLSSTAQTVAASIGGVPCMVTFAGLAPGLVGIYQLNIMVEPSVASGTRELTIAVGGVSSQESAFIEVQ